MDFPYVLNRIVPTGMLSTHTMAMAEVFLLTGALSRGLVFTAAGQETTALMGAAVATVGYHFAFMR